MKKKYASLLFFGLAVLLATFQLVKFDYVIAHTSGWTDGQADSWTVFSPVMDNIILLIVVVLASMGAYTGLGSLRRRWLRVLLTVFVALAAWIVFIMIQLAIQQHLSHFKGV